jgi:hypothetical protein
VAIHGGGDTDPRRATDGAPRQGDRGDLPGGLHLRTALEERCLPRFRAVWRGIGNCHVATEAIRRDLEPLGADNPFAFLCGSSALLVTERDSEGFHCWIEHDGWAIDVANGAGGNPILITPVNDFYAMFELTRIRRKAEAFGA